ncbi:hypothetical protein [Paenibacillus flagellatus]|uniref:Uncharacterized protein n=1 Tax=Paenibacillus flagellatus TaxID=2211139 RepID=A0A2V5KEI5_9BACL|nr:hypothetical protein [Paenibacillus flagellatus]PYI57532.1 hypothetical protein DLM86_03630 [Paenibacillus flagellatus]
MLVLWAFDAFVGCLLAMRVIQDGDGEDDPELAALRIRSLLMLGAVSVGCAVSGAVDVPERPFRADVHIVVWICAAAVVAAMLAVTLARRPRSSAKAAGAYAMEAGAAAIALVPMFATPELYRFQPLVVLAGMGGLFGGYVGLRNIRRRRR